MQGRDGLRRSTNTRDRLAKAEPLLNAAVKLDPGFARAWCALAGLHIRAYTTIDQSASRLAQVKACTDTAVRLAPDDPDVVLGLGNYIEITGDLARAAELYQRVVRTQLNNTDALLALSFASRKAGRWVEALATVRQVRALDPRAPDTGMRLFRSLFDLRRYEEMEQLARESLSALQLPVLDEFEVARLAFYSRGASETLDAFVAKVAQRRRTEPDALIVAAQRTGETGDAAGLIRLWEEAGPDWRYSAVKERYDLLVVAMAWIKLGQPERAKPVLEKNRDLLKVQLVAQPTNVTKQIDLALTYAMLGDKATAREFLAKVEKPEMLGGAGVDAAVVHAWLGQKDRAIALLANMLTHPGVPFFGNVHALRRDLSLWPIQGDPAFEALLNDPKNNAPLF
ncbi:MAG: hypothetical protein EXS37_09235 [Opitutus sp.]|nr:hypothetical protein [Opitutus sp.]